MKVMLLLVSSIFSLNVFSAQKYSECIQDANLYVGNYGGGMDDAAFYLNEAGKTVVRDESKIVKRVIEKETEKVTYKEKVFGGFNSEKPEFKTVVREITIKRDSSGKLQSVFKNFDRDTNSGINGGPFGTNSIESKYTYNSDSCKIDQIVSGFNFKNKDEFVVNYDKKFCDIMEPQIRRLGTQNAQQCAGFIGQATLAINQRNTELQKSGSKMGFLDSNGKVASSPTMSAYAHISSCLMGVKNSYLFPAGMSTGMMAPMPGMMMSFPTTPADINPPNNGER